MKYSQTPSFVNYTHKQKTTTTTTTNSTHHPRTHTTEYAYGGHSFAFSGVFEINPKDEIALGEENFKFKETIMIGYTDFNNDEVREIINNLGNEFTGDKYHLLHKNCNHFTDCLAKILCGKGLYSP